MYWVKIEHMSTFKVSTLTQDIFLSRIAVKNLSISSGSMIMVLLQTKLEVILPKDVGGVACLTETDASC